MNRSRDPDPEDAPPAPHPQGDGLAEKLEHGVEQTVEIVEHAVERVDHAMEGVVEHVPETLREPVRWTVHKLVLVVVLSTIGFVFLVVAGAGYYLWNHTQWAARELTGRINQTLTSRSDVMLSVAGVRGNPLSTVEVLHPRVRFRDGPVLLEASSMRVRYSTWDLFMARRGAIVIEIAHPEVRLARGADGRIRYPLWKPGPPRKGTARGFDFVVKIRDGDFRVGDSGEGIEDFDLDATAATGAPTRVDVRSLTWKRGPYGLVLQRFAGTLDVADSVKIRVEELRSADLMLRGSASWKRDAAERVVDADIERIRWRWLARVFRNGIFDVPGEGAFRLAARGDQAWSGEFRSRAQWGDLPLQGEGRFGWGRGRLQLAPLVGTSAAGDLVGQLAWSKQGWEIGGTVAGANPARWGAIGIRGWPEGRMNGRFRYQVDSRDRNRSRLLASVLGSDWAGWRTDSATVAIQFPPEGPDSFRVQAQRRGGLMTLAGAAHEGTWTGAYTISQFPLDEWPDGRATGLRGMLVQGSGTVQGRDGGLAVTGTLAGAATSWFGTQAGRWRMTGVQGALLPTPDLDAHAVLEDVVVMGVHFDSVASPFHLGNDALEFAQLRAWAGDTLVALSGRTDWTDGGWSFAADSAVARSSRFHWTAVPPLQLLGEPRGVTFRRLVGTDGEARLDVSGRWAGPGGTYDWEARGERLDLGRLGLPAELGLQGNADARLRVQGPSDHPEWEFQGVCRSPGARGHTADSLSLALSGAPSRLDVKDLVLTLNGGRLHGACRIEGTGHPWPDTLTGDGVRLWLADAAHWSGTVRAQDLPVDGLGQLAPAAIGWSGRLTGAIEIAGRPGRPDLSLLAEGRPLAWRNFRMNLVQARAAYHEERLVVQELRMTRDDGVSTVVGEMPLTLDLSRAPEVPETEMSWRLDLPNGDLALLMPFVAQVGSASGSFDIDAQVGGTPRHPVLRGAAHIRGGRLRIAGREEVLEDVRARLSLAQSRVTLDSLTAVQRTRQREPGRVWGRGVVNLQGTGLADYAFELSLRDFTALESGVYAARFDGDFKVTNGPLVAGHTVPHVTSDNVEVRRAVILYDFTKQTEAQQVAASTQPLYWTYRMKIHANDNLHWQPADGDIEFSADLSLQQTPGQFVMFGDMEALRGAYYFLSNRFTVKSALIRFDDVGGVDPTVDAEATTRLIPSQRIVLPDGSVKRDEPTTITVKVQGRSSRPSVEFSSDPVDLDEAQILRELTVGRFVQGETVGESLTDPADSYLTRAINRQLSTELSKAFRGYLTEWEIARESGGVLKGGGLIVGVGSQLNSRLAVRYRQLLPGTGRTAAPGEEVDLIERDIEAEYRLNRFFFITSQLKQKRSLAGTGATVSGAADFNVNLKARWEY